MAVTLTISKVILAIADVADKFQLLPCTAPTFFREWQDNINFLCGSSERKLL